MAIHIQKHPVILPSTALVANPPQYEGNLQKLEAIDLVSKDRFRMIVLALPEYRYGDKLMVDGQLRNGLVYFPKLTLLERNKGNLALSAIYSIRSKFQFLTSQIFPQPYASLVLGIIFGIQSDFGQSLNDQLRRAGLLHVVVASGYNVSVIVGYLSALLKALQKKLVTIIIVGVVLVYAVIAGFDPPILRASIMAVASLISVIFGRQKHSFLWLIFSAAILVIISPEIYKRVSFQLSFFATLAILMLRPFFEEKLVLLSGVLRDDTATTLAVTVFTAPIIILNFGKFYPQGILVNVLSLWLIPVIMITSTIAILVGLINVFAARIVAVPAQVLLMLVLNIAESVA